MLSSDPPEEPAATARDAGQSVYRAMLNVVLTGIAVILPVVITIFVLKAALDMITSALAPVVEVLNYFGILWNIKADGGLITALQEIGLYSNVGAFLSEIIAVFLLALIVVGVGAVAQMRHGDRLIDYFDGILMALPGIGSIYKSFRRMSDVVLESDTDHFQSVKLVEFPHDETYVLGFETAGAPEAVNDTAGHEDMVTLFLPLAPNPVMGGFLTHVPGDRVADLDMTVEEGVQSIITSGIATGQVEDAPKGFESLENGDQLFSLGGDDGTQEDEAKRKDEAKR